MTFTDYLEHKKHSPRTIATYTAYLVRFLSWLETDNLTGETFTYTDLLGFMRDCHSRGVTKRTVQTLLGIIRHWCGYLIQQGKRTDNPAEGIFIKGLVRKLPANLLTMEEMETLYRQYCIQLQVDSAKKIMLGLMVYQGLRVGEIIGLKRHHLRLQDGKIFIAAGKKTGERLLDLHAVQVPELQSYLTKNRFKEGSLLVEKIKDTVSPAHIHNRISYMFDQLKKLNPKVINASQIRSSVITHWLKQYNLREVQYMAGHKYVSSTARYQVGDLEDLQ